MRVHSEEKIKELKKLRRRGFSINEIVERLLIPKSTVWHHIQGVKVASKYKEVLKSKRGGSKKRTLKKWQKAREDAGLIMNSKNRELAIVLAMLHWCEGHKRVCEFTNSDGVMVRVYLIILRKVFNIPEESIKPVLRIFGEMDRDRCLNYWSKTTQISKSRFKIRLNDGGTKGRTEYGICRLTVEKGSNMLKLIHSLIDKISDEILSNNESL